MWRFALELALGLALGLAALPAAALDAVETPSLAARVARGELPPVAARLPAEPLVVDPEASGRTFGRPGGSLVTLAPRARDIRYVSTFSYARLVGYDEALHLGPDILARVDDEAGRVFTLHLRPGHRWSDGHPFTAEDFRYFWEDVATNRELTPGGVPDFLLVDGRPPRFEVIDERTIRYAWDAPNPRFLPALAAPRDPYIYRPAHYLKRYHAVYTDPDALLQKARRQKLASWAALHNRVDDMNEGSNLDMPTLNPWRIATPAPASRFVFERNPYYHRVDTRGQQLPYIDRIVVDVAAAGLFAAKANAGEADLLARGLSILDVPILKEGERARGYRTLLWRNARGSELALYPNLNVVDPVWRALNRDVRFRRALSLGIDRRTLNNALFFGLGVEGANTVLEGSALHTPDLRTTNATYDPAEARRLLDAAGLNRRDGSGTRLLSDGRPLEIVVETDGDAPLVVDGLTLIAEFWREIGIRLIVKPQDRTVLRNRIYAGHTVLSAGPGLDNATPTPVMVPVELAPMRQDTWSWPKWGQYAETRGGAGEAVDMPEAMALQESFGRWAASADEAGKAAAWRDMLENHARNVWTIGTVAGAPHPIVVRSGLENLPRRGDWAWEPTAMLGVYRLDELYWSRPADGRPS
ncbi:ABC transporter substrate-binding protein [Salinarimonas soli]|uniref:ABC transporter substrate-binding protein n=1 Tax=Salinarimonas soli TaxID=1638099 RepID=A0A5B2VI55_9HYPH|nr:ABC transporter substrate-binding protein [Salinarimonas soli]KAA2238236.1 ABC transporter substrate-binding protein [Salinarimonas soli]